MPPSARERWPVEDERYVSALLARCPDGPARVSAEAWASDLNAVSDWTGAVMQCGSNDASQTTLARQPKRIAAAGAVGAG